MHRHVLPYYTRKVTKADFRKNFYDTISELKITHLNQENFDSASQILTNCVPYCLLQFKPVKSAGRTLFVVDERTGSNVGDFELIKLSMGHFLVTLLNSTDLGLPFINCLDRQQTIITKGVSESISVCKLLKSNAITSFFEEAHRKFSDRTTMWDPFDQSVAGLIKTFTDVLDTKLTLDDPSIEDLTVYLAACFVKTFIEFFQVWSKRSTKTLQLTSVEVPEFKPSNRVEFREFVESFIIDDINSSIITGLDLDSKDVFEFSHDTLSRIINPALPVRLLEAVISSVSVKISKVAEAKLKFSHRFNLIEDYCKCMFVLSEVDEYTPSVFDLTLVSMFNDLGPNLQHVSSKEVIDLVDCRVKFKELSEKLQEKVFEPIKAVLDKYYKLSTFVDFSKISVIYHTRFNQKIISRVSYHPDHTIPELIASGLDCHKGKLLSYSDVSDLDFPRNFIAANSQFETFRNEFSNGGSSCEQSSFYDACFVNKISLAQLREEIFNACRSSMYTYDSVTKTLTFSFDENCRTIFAPRDDNPGFTFAEKGASFKTRYQLEKDYISQDLDPMTADFTSLIFAFNGSTVMNASSSELAGLYKHRCESFGMGIADRMRDIVGTHGGMKDFLPPSVKMFTQGCGKTMGLSRLLQQSSVILLPSYVNSKQDPLPSQAIVEDSQSFGYLVNRNSVDANLLAIIDKQSYFASSKNRHNKPSVLIFNDPAFIKSKQFAQVNNGAFDGEILFDKLTQVGVIINVSLIDDFAQDVDLNKAHRLSDEKIKFNVNYNIPGISTMVKRGNCVLHSSSASSGAKLFKSYLPQVKFKKNDEGVICGDPIAETLTSVFMQGVFSLWFAEGYNKTSKVSSPCVTKLIDKTFIRDKFITRYVDAIAELYSDEVPINIVGGVGNMKLGDFILIARSISLDVKDSAVYHSLLDSDLKIQNLKRSESLYVGPKLSTDDFKTVKEKDPSFRLICESERDAIIKLFEAYADFDLSCQLNDSFLSPALISEDDDLISDIASGYIDGFSQPSIVSDFKMSFLSQLFSDELCRMIEANLVSKINTLMWNKAS